MMSSPRSKLNTRLLWLTLLAGIIAVACITGSAPASSRKATSTQYNYWTGTANNLTGHASGLLVPRDYNRMYHTCPYPNGSYESVVTYQDGGGTAHAADQDDYLSCRNPVHLSATSNNWESWCAGNGPVTNVTCQTTKP
jgi:hypothetical protein